MALKDRTNITLNEALREASFFLNQHDWDGDLARNYWMYLFDWDLTQLVSQLHQIQDEERIQRYQDALLRLINHEPIQYISGYAYFMGDRYQVTPATLIPREETQGLVERALKVLEDEEASQRVLDIGTGTGIIAIELKKAFPEMEIWASDLSTEALQVAKANAEARHLEIRFIQSDLFQELDPEKQFDVIVSNPPYIGEEELDVMDMSVKKYEPSMALFAEQDGLAIYRGIAQALPQYLAVDGQALFEIGYRQGSALIELFQKALPQAKIWVEQDYLGKDRYLCVDRRKEWK